MSDTTIVGAVAALVGAVVLWTLRAARRAVAEGDVTIRVGREEMAGLRARAEAAERELAESRAQAAQCRAHAEEWARRYAELVDERRDEGDPRH